MTTGKVDSAGVLSLLADDLSRNILVLLSERALAVSEIVQHCEVSDRTVYRRIRDLKTHDLVDETTQIDTGGQFHSKYRTSVEHIDIDIDISPEEDTLEVNLTRRDDLDGFIDLWSGLKTGTVDSPEE